MAGTKPFDYGRWAVYADEDWMQIWLGQETYGLYVYALRWGMDSGRYRVLESWFGPDVWTRQDQDAHHQFVTDLLDSLAGVQRQEFAVGQVQGSRGRKNVQFSGTVSTIAAVDELAQCLREQVALMSDSDHDRQRT
jgi:hypothetical protein